MMGTQWAFLSPASSLANNGLHKYEHINTQGGAQVSTDQITPDRAHKLSLCTLSRSEWCEGRGQDERRSPDTRCGDWSLSGDGEELRGCHHRSLASSVHMYSGPLGRPGGGKMWNIHQGSCLNHLNPTPVIHDFWSSITYWLEYFKHRNVSRDNDAPACLWCEPRSQFLSTYDRACLWWCLVFMAVNWSILLILTVPVKHERDTVCLWIFSVLCSVLTSQWRITIDSCLNVSCSMLCPISCIQILER